MRCGCEGRIEGEDGPGAFEAVAGEVEFGHSVDLEELVMAVSRTEWLGHEEAGGGEGGRRRKWIRVRHTILEVHFHGWPVRRFAHPYVEVFAFAGFEKEDIVAVVEVGELV